MYAPRAGIEPELGDVEVIVADGQIHLFGLTPPNNDAVSHAVSDDGITWRELPVALRTGQPGACDDDEIWTMSVTERDGTYSMLYTALATAEDGRVQRCALATSTDLVTWTKHEGNPIGEADPRWYEADPEPGGCVSWRDPKPIKIGETYYAAVAAREADGPLARRGCVGLMASDDLVHWEVRPPLFAPRRYWDLECPQVFTIDGHYYLTAALMENRHQQYWQAPAFEGPYEIPADGGLLVPLGHYAGRVVRWNGQDLLFAWHKMARPAGTWIEYDWPGNRIALGMYLVAPLVLERRDDGSLVRRSLPAWAEYRTAPLTPAEPAASTICWERAADGWRVESPDGMDILATANEGDDLWIEGTMTLDAGLGGLAFRLDEQGCGYFVDLAVGSDEVALQKWLPARHADGSRPWFRRMELQRQRLRQPVEAGASVPFTLLLVGPYIELSLGGEVVIATLSWERRSGGVGVWVDSGTLVAESVRWAPMRAPAHG